MKKGDRVTHTRFKDFGIVVEPTDPLIGKLILVEWDTPLPNGERKAWCGQQWVVPA